MTLMGNVIKRKERKQHAYLRKRSLPAGNEADEGNFRNEVFLPETRQALRAARAAYQQIRGTFLPRQRAFAAQAAFHISV